jgi:ATP-binding cassette subfamily B protein
VGNASLQTRSTQDVQFMSEMITWSFRIFTLPIFFIGGILFALSVDVKLSAVSLVATPAILLVLIFINRFMRPLSKVANYHMDKSNLILRERLTGLRVIRAFHKEEYEHDRFTKQIKIMSSNFIRRNSMQGSLSPLLTFINNMTILLLLYFGAKFITDGSSLI